MAEWRVPIEHLLEFAGAEERQHYLSPERTEAERNEIRAELEEVYHSIPDPTDEELKQFVGENTWRETQHNPSARDLPKAQWKSFRKAQARAELEKRKAAIRPPEPRDERGASSTRSELDTFWEPIDEINRAARGDSIPDHPEIPTSGWGDPKPVDPKPESPKQPARRESTDEELHPYMPPNHRTKLDDPATQPSVKSQIRDTALRRWIGEHYPWPQPPIPSRKDSRNALMPIEAKSSAEELALREREELLEREERRQREESRPNRNRKLDSRFVRRAWAEIVKHKGWYIFAFIAWGLPIGIAAMWPMLVRDKTLQEWLAANGWPRLTALVIGWLAVLCVSAVIIVARSSMRAYAPVTSTPEVKPKAPLDIISLNEVRSEWAKLTDAQKALLKRILVNDGLNWNQIDDKYWRELPTYADFQLSDYLLEHSTLLEHKSKGNADLRRYIDNRKTGKVDITLGVRTWKVKNAFKAALEHVISEDER